METGLRPVSTDNNDEFKVYNYNDSLTVKLSSRGRIIQECWLDLPNHYENILLDEFVIMPNHFHGIIIIKNHTIEKQIHGLSEFVRAFKSFSSRKINKLQNSTISDTWQPRYYDHIIRSENELDNIRAYIKDNPRNWLNDEHYFNPMIL